MTQDSRDTIVWIAVSLLLLVVFGAFLFPPAWTKHPTFSSQQEMNHDSGAMPGMDAHAVAEGETHNQQAKHLADKRESELSHHLAGVLITMAGLFFLVQTRLGKRWKAAGYAWPICILATGFFVLIFSDTEIWPFGYQSFYFAVTDDPEVAQHKVFALLLLALGAVEVLRASRRLKAAWSAWVIPVVSLCGAVMLLFHHHGGMDGPQAMQAMVRVQNQHLRFAQVGVGIALVKGMAEIKVIRWRPLFNRLWPLFTVVLGALLLLYRE